MRRQLDLVGRDRPRPCAITTRNADKREARRSHHAEPDSITRKKKRGVQPRSLLRYRMRYPRENQAAAEVQPKEQKKPHPQKWRERFAEPIRRRTAPLCLRQIERRGRDHRALRDAKEEQQVDEIGFPCDRRAASNQRKHERDRAEHDHRASDRLHGRAGHRLLPRPPPSASTRHAPLPPPRIEPRSQIDPRRSARCIPAPSRSWAHPTASALRRSRKFRPTEPSARSR